MSMLPINLTEDRCNAAKNPEELVRRSFRSDAEVWLLLDDVDRSYVETAEYKTRTAAFFIACLELTRDIPSLRIRSSIRPNVWTSLRREHEHLSHAKEHVQDLSWSEEDVLGMLAKRVEAYLIRTNQLEYYSRAHRNLAGEARNKALVACMFESPIRWGRKGSERPPHVAMYTLAKHRPRWVIELAKASTKRAYEAGRTVVTRADLVKDYAEFGNARIDDTVAEFKGQCPQVEELVRAFHRQPEIMSTDELMKVIDRKVLNHLSVQISGTLGNASARDIASFLFQIGLYYGRRDYQDGSYGHVTYAQMPTLLKSRTLADAGLRWEIHPVYRQALEMRGASGDKISQIDILRTTQDILQDLVKEEKSVGEAKTGPRRRLVRKKNEL